MKQGELFGNFLHLPPDFEYEAEFMTRAEEAALLTEIASLPLTEAKYKEYTAKRRIVSESGRAMWLMNSIGNMIGPSHQIGPAKCNR